MATETHANPLADQLAELQKLTNLSFLRPLICILALALVSGFALLFGGLLFLVPVPRKRNQCVEDSQRRNEQCLQEMPKDGGDTGSEALV